MFEFPEPVKAAVSPWSLTREDGTEFEMTGMDEFGPNTIAIFVEKESYGGNAVSKVKSRTPQRTPPRPRYTPREFLNRLILWQNELTSLV